MALESRETSNGFAPEPKRRHAVRDALLCVWDDRNDRVAQLGKRCSLGLIKRAEVLVDLFLGHSGIVKVGAEGVKVAQACPARRQDLAPPRLRRPRPDVAGGGPGLSVMLGLPGGVRRRLPGGKAVVPRSDPASGSGCLSSS